jgi:hypothetical protein
MFKNHSLVRLIHVSRRLAHPLGTQMREQTLLRIVALSFRRHLLGEDMG